MSDPQNPNDPYGQSDQTEPQPWTPQSQQSAGQYEQYGQQPSGQEQYGQYDQQGGQYGQPGGQYGQPGTQYGPGGQYSPSAGSYGQPQGAYQQQGFSGGAQRPGLTSTDGKGFFSALFDFNFSSFVTPKIIKIVYLVVTAVIAASLLFFIIAALLTGDALPIIGALIIGPLVALIYLALARMSLELYYAVIRLSEDVHERLPRQ